MTRVRWVFIALLFTVALGVSCVETPTGGGTRLFQVNDRRTLVGGPMALGDIGDFVMENGRLRAVISKVGISKAFGLFGGNIIDADRVRGALGQGNSQGGAGFDSLVEMFPLFFLSSVDPKESKVINNGADGNPAVLRISGEGASFIALTESINNIVTYPGGKNRLAFDVDYILAPGTDYIQLKIKVTNKEDKEYRFGGILGKLVPAITGMVGLFGKRNTVFIPGMSGYNIRFSLQQVFKTDLKPPAIPGLIGDFVSSWGQNGVSYGIVAAQDDENYVFKNREEFAKLGSPLSKGSLIVPMEGSSITAGFTKQAPFALKKDESFTYTIYIVIGDGSVGSIRNAQLEIHKKPKGLFGGRLVEKTTYNPIQDAHIIVYTGALPNDPSTLPKPGDRQFYTDLRTDAAGNFQGYLEPGTYTVLARTGYMKSEPIQIEIKKDAKTFKQLELPQFGYIAFTVRDQKGRLLPSKVSALGQVKDFVYRGVKGGCIGKIPIYCLYDPHLGESKIDSDFKVGLSCDGGKPCSSSSQCKGLGNGICDYRLGPKTEYREGMVHSMTGLGRIAVRPGTYKVVASRGIEYDLGIQESVTVAAGELKTVNLTLVHSVPTPKAVSIDMHVHTNFSHDVSISDSSRIASYVAEGVDTFVTTDHNRIRDMRPLVESLRLERWVKTFIGVELTTFEMGHFNAFPLKLDTSSFNGGNPVWFKKDERYTEDLTFPKGTELRPLTGYRRGVPPGEMFSNLKVRASLCDNDPKCDKVVVQVNHPRDSIFGYFNTYNLSGDSGFPLFKKVGLLANATQPVSREFDADQFSLNFNAIELFNGARFDLMWHWRLPPGVKPPSGYGGSAGTRIRVDEDGRARIAFPGGIDDWFNMLNRGLQFTATANSDSHNHDPEAGFPRSYLLTGFDDLQQMTKEKLAELVLGKKVMLTNGPILEVQAKGSDGTLHDMGDTIKATSKITFNIKVRAAAWVDISEILVYKNGKLARSIKVPESTKPERYNRDLEFDISDGDAWFVFVTKGQKGLWPVLRSEEIEPFQISEAVDLIQQALLNNLPISIGGSDPACLRPSIVRQVYPYAFTNPFWIDTDGDGKYTPNPCKTLGELGVRCATKGTTCQAGRCLNPAATCKSDADCKQIDQDIYSTCVDGQCTVDPCAGMTCASNGGKFIACTDKTPCASDDCPAKDKRCSDGTVCTQDSQCAGKGDGFCRYCACPNARKACPDGKACGSDADCGGAACASLRFCQPTACTLGYCMPTYPTCKVNDQTQNAHLFLQMKTPIASVPKATSIKGNTLKQKYQISYKSISVKSVIEQQKKSKDPFSIRNASPYFLFFEHKH